MMQMRLILLGACLAFTGIAQTDGVHRVGKDVSSPKIIHHTEPSYSEEARRALVNAKVLLDLVVNEMGIPENVRVKRGAGFGLDEMAIKAVESWRFNPGMKAGTAVKVLANVEVNFRLLDSGRTDQNASLNFAVRTGQLAPKLVKGTMPGNFPGNGQDKMRIKLSINKEGVVTAMDVLETSNRNWSNLAQLEIGAWRFEPGTEATATLELSNTSPKLNQPVRKSDPVAIVPIAKQEVVDPTLTAPQLIAPSVNEEFSIYPRTTKFRWIASPGAISYLLEWDYGNNGIWEAESNKRPGVAYTVTGTQFQFDFVGTQMGRWRVWPINAKGQQGTPSEWRTFRHLK